MSEPTEAGRAMNAVVAERVLGWERYTAIATGKRIVVLVPEYGKLWSWFMRSQTDKGGWERTDHPLTASGYRYLPNYSTDIAAAWEVLDKVKPATIIELRYQPADSFFDGEGNQPVREEWTCYVEDVGEARGPTAPLAICRAALACVGRGTTGGTDGQ
jgi:hypothetical protein